MGLCPKSFGPYFWGAFHLACLANVDKEALKTFIETYQMVLPCFGCRMHFSQLLAEYPFPETDQFRWSVDIHNIVNQRIDKPVMSYEDALAHWLSGCEPEVETVPEPEPLFDSTTILLMVLLVILITAILFRR
jgi:hypothetical protein